MVDNRTGGPDVFQNADGSFKQAKGRLTSMPKQPKISNLAPPGMFDDGEKETTPEVSKEKSSKEHKRSSSKNSNFGPVSYAGKGGVLKRKKSARKSPYKPKMLSAYGPTGKKPAKKVSLATVKALRAGANDEDKKKKTDRPKNGRVLGQRILGLRAEMRKLQKRINKATHLLKAQRKEVKAMQTELFDLMDNTEQLNLPFN